MSEPEPELPILDHELANLSITFPLHVVQDGADVVLTKIEKHLPPHPRAWALCEAYLEHFSWWFRPIKRDELIDEFLTSIYKCVGDPASRGYLPKHGTRCPHRLAVLYFILAVGALVDLTLPACNVEAEKYFQLGRAALSLRSIFDSPEIETVQAVSLLAAYQSACSRRYSHDGAWSIISLAVKLAQSCITLGRPTSIAEVHIDCELPIDEEESIGEDGEKIAGYWWWKMNYGKNVFIKVIDTLLSAKPPNYETVLEMDKLIRQAELPKIKLYLKPEEDDYADPGACMRSYLMSQIRSISMLAIHRTFFAQALLDHPNNPLRSPYAPSFLSANRCACIVIRSFIHHFERRPDLCGRFWSIWTHAFTAAVVLGSTVKWCPSATMAPSALIELDLTIELFKKGAFSSPRARMAVPILSRLRDRATAAYQQFRHKRVAPNTLDIQVQLLPEDASEDKLAIFGGQTRVVSTKLLTRKRPKTKTLSTSSINGTSSGIPLVNGSSPLTEKTCDSRRSSRQDSMSSISGDSPPRTEAPSPATASTPSDSIPDSLVDAFNEVHPTLVEYLSFFPSSAAVVDTSQCLVDPPATAVPSTPTALTNGHSTSFSSFTPESIGDLSVFSPPASASTPTMFPYFVNSPAEASANQMGMDVDAMFAMGPHGGVGGVPDLLSFPDDMMDEQWINLIRDAGVLDFNSGFNNGGMNFPSPTEPLQNGHSFQSRPPNR
ncbi:hypothetical protein QCA50_010540 [Cerrena zonata]|uniref:Transcription factor domain-containing protein n=1 Tax=Cerrena zonata TaxID=2478898 RepID=A0AAW0FZ92_9APHY